jgi:hypothetical protein
VQVLPWLARGAPAAGEATLMRILLAGSRHTTPSCRPETMKGTV